MIKTEFYSGLEITIRLPVYLHPSSPCAVARVVTNKSGRTWPVDAARRLKAQRVIKIYPPLLSALGRLVCAYIAPWTSSQVLCNVTVSVYVCVLHQGSGVGR